MDLLADFVLGDTRDPLEAAVRLLLFLILTDSIFGIVNTLLSGVRR